MALYFKEICFSFVKLPISCGINDSSFWSSTNHTKETSWPIPSRTIIELLLKLSSVKFTKLKRSMGKVTNPLNERSSLVRETGSWRKPSFCNTLWLALSELNDDNWFISGTEDSWHLDIMRVFSLGNCTTVKGRVFKLLFEISKLFSLSTQDGWESFCHTVDFCLMPCADIFSTPVLEAMESLLSTTLQHRILCDQYAMCKWHSSYHSCKYMAVRRFFTDLFPVFSPDADWDWPMAEFKIRLKSRNYKCASIWTIYHTCQGDE